MTFLNGLLAFGTLAAVIPLAIHLLNRSRFRRLEWGAMHLLESVIRTNQRRFRLDQLLLLLVRCAIPVLLALCMARPVLTGLRQLRGDAPISLLIVLDDSYSMATRDGSTSRFDLAVTEIEQVVESLARGSDVNVLLTGGSPRPLFEDSVRDTETIVSRLRRITPAYDGNDVGTVLDRATVMIGGMAHESREIIFVSDFQAGDWSGVGSAIVDGFSSRLTESSSQVDLTLIQIGEPLAGNVAITAVDVPVRSTVPGESVVVRAELRSFGDAVADDVPVRLFVEGEEVSQAEVAVAQNGSAQVTFPLSLDEPGSLEVSFRAETGDLLPADDRVDIAVNVREPIKVLLVEGQRGQRPLAGDLDYVSLALTPHTFGLGDRRDRFETTTISARGIEDTALNVFDVVAMAGVRNVTDRALDLLTAFVDAGGGLLVVPSDGLDFRWYNSQLRRDEGDGLLPAQISKTLSGPEGEPLAILEEQYTDPALTLFNDAANGRLSEASIIRWYPLTLASDAAISTQSGVAARLTNDSPLFCRNRFGAGRVIQFAISLDTECSDLPLRPFFVPLIQELFRSLARPDETQWNVSPGGTVVVPVAVDAGETATVEYPTGERRPVALERKGAGKDAATEPRVTFSDTLLPGAYRVADARGGRSVFAVQATRGDSMLNLLDEKQLTELASQVGGAAVRSFDEYRLQTESRRSGRPLWRIVLLGVLGLLVLELFLQQRFSREPT